MIARGIAVSLLPLAWRRGAAGAVRPVLTAAVAALLLLAGVATPARAHGPEPSDLTTASDDAPRPPDLTTVGFTQRPGEQVPLDLAFRDETGETVTLGSYFTGKPVILTMNYYNCPDLCPLVLDGLVNGLRTVPFTISQQFDIVTVSVDPRETPEMAAAAKRSYVRHYAEADAAQGWHFLTGGGDSIQSLADAIGFAYAYDGVHDEYAHPAGIVMLTPEGKISRYLYGIEFAATDLRLGLVETSEHRIGTAIDQVLLLCYHYDPAAGKYGNIVIGAVRASGVATVLALGGFLFLMLRAEHRRNQRQDIAS